MANEIEKGSYNLEIDVYVDSLPNSTGFYRLGKGKLIHNQEGFKLTAKFQDHDFVIAKPVLSNYGVHVEYGYFGKGDCISFSTTKDSYYLFPVNKDVSVTKIHFAVEELYKIKTKNSTSQ